MLIKKDVDTDPKAIQQTECIVQLKNTDRITADGNQPMFVLTILEKIKETRAKFSQGRVIVLKKMRNSQLSKLKYAAKNETGITIRITKKNFQSKELSHELFLKTRQETKLRNAFVNNMSTDTKLSKT